MSAEAKPLEMLDDGSPDLLADILSGDENMRLFALLQFLCCAEVRFRSAALMLDGLKIKMPELESSRDLGALVDVMTQHVARYSEVTTRVYDALSNRQAAKTPEAAALLH